MRAVRVRVPRVGVRSGGERSGVCRVQEECSRHGLMGRVPRVQGSGYRVGVRGLPTCRLVDLLGSWRVVQGARAPLYGTKHGA